MDDPLRDVLQILIWSSISCVLILIVMDDPLRGKTKTNVFLNGSIVLILIVMDDPLRAVQNKEGRKVV
mgnify:CR=1 FL=1